MADHDIAVPLHTSLTTPILLGGVPRSFAILNVTICAVIGLGLYQIWLALPVGLMAHSLALWLTQQDPWWMDVLKRHLKEKPFYRG
ncbi:MAG: VirB3 family type IV secretion system protein [Pseudomonadota bacterium]